MRPNLIDAWRITGSLRQAIGYIWRRWKAIRRQRIPAKGHP